MKPQDNPDTVIVDEQTHWEATQMEDVFLPSVRVQVSWADLEKAVSAGAVVPTQAHALWAAWAAPGSSTRVGASMMSRPNFDSTLSDLPDLPGHGDGPSPLLRWGSWLLAALVGAALMRWLG